AGGGFSDQGDAADAEGEGGADMGGDTGSDEESGHRMFSLGMFKDMLKPKQSWWQGLLGTALGAVLHSFGGGMAEGGPVDPGSAYMVGEAGPEIFVPSTQGRILPNYALAGGGGITINYHIDAHGAELGAEN